MIPHPVHQSAQASAVHNVVDYDCPSGHMIQSTDTNVRESCKMLEPALLFGKTNPKGFLPHLSGIDHTCGCQVKPKSILLQSREQAEAQELPSKNHEGIVASLVQTIKSEVKCKTSRQEEMKFPLYSFSKVHWSNNYSRPYQLPTFLQTWSECNRWRRMTSTTYLPMHAVKSSTPT